ncbi:MAG: sigma factor-like helix-turn-helix DNA-binding protein [Magnetospirillum sp.]|nr:sigma factor-like helix-turn-helix DNA-binding protein [Magnetospirillum sp.]
MARQPMPAARQCREVIVECLAGLAHRQRIALSLYYFSEASGPQAARMLDIPVAALEALLVRGRRALKEALAARGVTGVEDIV